MPEPGAPQQVEQPEPFAAEKTLAEIKKLMAGADREAAQADKVRMDTALAPAQAEHQQRMDQAQFVQGARDSEEDRKLAAKAAARKTVAA